MARVSGQPQHRILFLLDEMAQLGRMDILADAVAIMRRYGMTMWIILQNLSQIKSLYPENRWEIFVEYFAEPYFQALVEGRSLENAEIVKIEPTPNPLRLISNLFKKERN